MLASLAAVNRTALLGVLFLGVLAATASAQCATQWVPGPGLPGTNGRVNAVLPWDPDGAGPLPPQIAIAGSFTIVGNQTVSRVAVYDPVTGTAAPLGAGVNDTVWALAVLPNGDLVAAGQFSTAGGSGRPRRCAR